MVVVLLSCVLCRTGVPLPISSMWTICSGSVQVTLAQRLRGSQAPWTCCVFGSLDFTRAPVLRKNIVPINGIQKGLSGIPGSSGGMGSDADSKRHQRTRQRERDAFVFSLLLFSVTKQPAFHSQHRNKLQKKIMPTGLWRPSYNMSQENKEKMMWENSED